MAMRIYGLYQRSRQVMTLLLVLTLCCLAVACASIIPTHYFSDADKQ